MPFRSNDKTGLLFHFLHNAVQTKLPLKSSFKTKESSKINEKQFVSKSNVLVKLLKIKYDVGTS